MSELSDELLMKVRPEERPALRFLAQAQHESIMNAVAVLLQHQTQLAAQEKLEREVEAAHAENQRYQSELDEREYAKAKAISHNVAPKKR